MVLVNSQALMLDNKHYKMENKKQAATVEKFCKNANYCLIKYERDFGKIIGNPELTKLDLSKNEIRRSIRNKDDSMLFMYKIAPQNYKFVLNPLQLLLHSLEEARAIETVYPHIFTWVYDGLFLNAYATIPSNDVKTHTIITRYGGTENFYKILIKHLNNIGNMKKGLSPDYDFTTFTYELEDNNISVASLNNRTKAYCIIINLTDSYKDILINSKNLVSRDISMNVLNMRYWTKEINPDFIKEAKHMKLANAIPFTEELYAIYPAPIKRLMNIPHKGNYYRFLLARFLLNVHSPKDAKHVYYSVLGAEELDHVKNGNCSTQWNYIKNNIQKYDAPSLKELKRFIYDGDPELAHVLEPLQDFAEKLKKDKARGE